MTLPMWKVLQIAVIKVFFLTEEVVEVVIHWIALSELQPEGLNVLSY